MTRIKAVLKILLMLLFTACQMHWRFFKEFGYPYVTLETFFAFGFVSTFAVALLAAWFRYLPTLIAMYRILVYQWNQPSPKRYAKDQL